MATQNYQVTGANHMFNPMVIQNHPVTGANHTLNPDYGSHTHLAKSLHPWATFLQYVSRKLPQIPIPRAELQIHYPVPSKNPMPKPHLPHILGLANFQKWYDCPQDLTTQSHTATPNNPMENQTQASSCYETNNPGPQSQIQTQPMTNLCQMNHKFLNQEPILLSKQNFTAIYWKNDLKSFALRLNQRIPFIVY